MNNTTDNTKQPIIKKFSWMGFFFNTLYYSGKNLKSAIVIYVVTMTLGVILDIIYPNNISMMTSIPMAMICGMLVVREERFINHEFNWKHFGIFVPIFIAGIAICFAIEMAIINANLPKAYCNDKAVITTVKEISSDIMDKDVSFVNQLSIDNIRVGDNSSNSKKYNCIADLKHSGESVQIHYVITPLDDSGHITVALI